MHSLDGCVIDLNAVVVVVILLALGSFVAYSHVVCFAEVELKRIAIKI